MFELSALCLVVLCGVFSLCDVHLSGCVMCSCVGCGMCKFVLELPAFCSFVLCAIVCLCFLHVFPCVMCNCLFLLCADSQIALRGVLSLCSARW